jgi:hypothetical protein
MPEGAAHDPSTFLSALGKGRLGRAQHLAILERHDGIAWREIGRFGSVQDADRALDEAVGGGAPPDTMRVLETQVASNRLLLIAGAIAIGAAIVIVLYVIFG